MGVDQRKMNPADYAMDMLQETAYARRTLGVPPQFLDEKNFSSN